jgi:hypothetical protein
MSRRWYRHWARVVFLGWEPTDQAFYVNVVDLCADCGGSGEQDGSDEVCPACGGEGMNLAQLSPSHRRSGLTLDGLAEHLHAHGLPFPPVIRSDLAEDQLINAGTLLREYNLDAG